MPAAAAASIVAVSGPAEPPDVCRERTRRATGTQELHAGEYLGREDEKQGDPEQNRRSGRPAGCGAAPHGGEECGQRNCVGRQVCDPGELPLTLQILDALTAPGGHGAPPDGNLNHTDDQHECRRDERPNRPGESGPGTGEPREDDNCSCRGDDSNRATRCPDLRQSPLGRHPSRNSRLRGGPIRRDLPRQVLTLAHARSIRPWRRSGFHRAQDRAPLSWTNERADTQQSGSSRAKRAIRNCASRSKTRR